MNYQSLNNSTISTIITKECRFCYSYTPHIPNEKSCNTVPSFNTITISSVINNSTRTSERSLLLASQNQMYQANYETAVNSTIQYTNNNSTNISNMIYAQLLQVRQNRYQPYQPYIPPFIPSSVIELQMNTVNVGVPHSFFTIADCKGSQSVTTTDVFIE